MLSTQKIRYEILIILFFKKYNIFTAICPSCENTVQKNQKRILCEVCMLLTHARCSEVACFSVKQVRADTPLT